ncbi:hypothetical protein Tco_0443002 [Tanacetum coccineum]
MERGFLSQKGSEVGRGVKEKNLNMSKMNTGIGLSTVSDGTRNEVGLVGDTSTVMEGVTPSVRIKSLHDDLGVIVAKLMLLLYKFFCLFKVDVAEVMDQDSLHMVAASKVPMLKPGEYELWRMRMEQYIQMIDYPIWEVIENGNAPPITKVV